MVARDNRETGPDTAAADREIVLTRLLDAPRELVWRAFTEPEHLLKWWGPDGFTNTFHEFDLRPGGVWRFVMHAPNGTDYDNFVRFLEVIEGDGIVFDQGSSADDILHRSSITLEDADGGTLVTLRVIFPTPEARDEAIEAVDAIEMGKQTLERLRVYLETM